MQCVACGGACEPDADVCPSCGSPTSVSSDFSPSHQPTPDYVSFPVDIVEAQRRRRKRVLIASAAAVAMLAALVITLKVTSASSYHDALDVPLAGQPTAAVGGDIVRYPAGHFRDRFPSTPVETQKSNSFGSQTFTVSEAVVALPDRIMVGCEDANVGIPADQAGAHSSGGRHIVLHCGWLLAGGAAPDPVS